MWYARGCGSQDTYGRHTILTTTQHGRHTVDHHTQQVSIATNASQATSPAATPRHVNEAHV